MMQNRTTRPVPSVMDPTAPFILAVAVTGLALATSAQAQSSTSGSGFNAGYGFTSGEMSNAVNVKTRDANGNKVIVDGVTQVGSDQSVFYSRQTGGAGDAYAGAGSTAGSAIGNNLQVSVVGSNNTVVVNSIQTNTGAVTAKTVLNGQVNLDGN